MRKCEYLLVKCNKEGLIYNKLFFNNSKNARAKFRKNDILLKCEKDSIYFADNWMGWTVKEKDIIAMYKK